MEKYEPVITFDQDFNERLNWAKELNPTMKKFADYLEETYKCKLVHWGFANSIDDTVEVTNLYFKGLVFPANQKVVDHYYENFTESHEHLDVENYNGGAIVLITHQF
ncbi:MAG: hypothetical protein QQN41_09045 [Nitrosopumilus sp.]